jgi:hypothetical protein
MDRVPESAENYSPDGVDLTLIRWMLSLTPRERLEVLYSNACSLEKLRSAAAGR